MTRMNNRDLLMRIDERVANIQKEVAGHNKKIDKLTVSSTKLQTQMKNHINLHKRDIGLIGIGLAILTFILRYV